MTSFSPSGISTDPIRTDPDLYREHCRLPAAVLAWAGSDVGQQVRLRRGRECVLSTVVDTDDRAVVAPELSGMLDGVGPLRVASRAPAPRTSLAAGEFVERTISGGPLVAVAPHGGDVEPHTDAQARRLARRDAAVWACNGWWPGGRAFDRWHVTSADIHPESFPALDGLLGEGSGKRGRFDAAVSFHGWRHEGVGIGGGASRDVRQQVTEAVERVLPPEVPVERIDEGDYSGDSPENIVNWLTVDGASGVQIEQSTRVRWRHGSAVADAAANVLL
ncbi:MAG: poly-gamma-glutamate hydrolase family protein [Haloarculaceae archaeon]